MSNLEQCWLCPNQTKQKIVRFSSASQVLQGVSPGHRCCGHAAASEAIRRPGMQPLPKRTNGATLPTSTRTPELLLCCHQSSCSRVTASRYSLREWPVWCGNWSSPPRIELWTGFPQKHTDSPLFGSRDYHQAVLGNGHRTPPNSNDLSGAAHKTQDTPQSSYSSGDICMRLGFPVFQKKPVYAKSFF